jgi:hypothetical protein
MDPLCNAQKFVLTQITVKSCSGVTVLGSLYSNQANVVVNQASSLGLTRESLFEILARSETRFLDPKFSRDSRKTHESKLIARLTSCESCRQKLRSKTHEKRVLLRNFVATIASHESRGKKFRSKACFSRVSHTNLIARLVSLANRNYVRSETRKNQY